MDIIALDRPIINWKYHQRLIHLTWVPSLAMLSIAGCGLFTLVNGMVAGSCYYPCHKIALYCMLSVCEQMKMHIWSMASVEDLLFPAVIKMIILKVNSLKLGPICTHISVKTCLPISLKEKTHLSYPPFHCKSRTLVKATYKVLSTNFKQSLKITKR